MRWFRIDKSTAPPVFTSWEDPVVKDHLRIEGRQQCVYCAIHEGVIGGIRAFHVEHYKPKSRFASLSNEIRNLFYACSICNQFKSNDWPAEPATDLSNSSYPDPSEVDYSTIFKVESETGLLRGRNVAAEYVISRIYLNRPQLILERVRIFLDDKLKVIDKRFSDLQDALMERVADPTARELLQKVIIREQAIRAHLLSLQNTAPYERADVTRGT